MDPLALVRALAAEQDGVVSAAQALAAGLRKHEIATLCRGGHWQRLARGMYAIDPSALTREGRIRAAVVSLGPDACAVLDSAAYLHGLAGLPPTGVVHVGVPGTAARPKRLAANLVVYQRVLRSQDVTIVGGTRTTTAQRTVADVVLAAPRYPAVCVLDSALNRKLLTEEEFAAVPAMLHRRRGAVRARQRLGEADGRARSPLETRVRLCCVDGGVAPDEIGELVYDEEGDVLAEADLLWRKPKVIAEADGVGPHTLPAAVFEDRRRQNVLANAGWLVLRFTWADTLRRGHIAETVRQAILARTQAPR